jgi:hypothetical protein
MAGVARERLPRFDHQAASLVRRIEREIVRLDLPSQGQFVSILNAIDVQIDGLEPDPAVVGHLADALLALARAREVDTGALRLHEHLHALRDRLTPSAPPHSSTR